MDENYSVYSKFDLEKHKKAFVDYLEVVVHRDGVIEYAVPSHNEKMIAIACKKLGITRSELNNMCPDEYYAYFAIWLSKMSGCCAVWNSFVIGFDFSIKQVEMLELLSKNGVYRGEIPKATKELI